jgi:Uma2 family endonuclease
MKVKAQATVDDLALVPGKAEIMNGEIVRMSPTQKLPNYAAGEIFVSLHQHSRRTGTGHAATDNLGFIVDLPHRTSFSPDVSYYAEEVNDEFGQGAPLFAVEVRSKGDYGPAAERAMAQKRADYFAAGTLVVWDVDVLRDKVVRVYRATQPDEPFTYHTGDLAEAEPAVPGWTMPVDDLFPQRRT